MTFLERRGSGGVRRVRAVAFELNVRKSLLSTFLVSIAGWLKIYFEKKVTVGSRLHRCPTTNPVRQH